MDAQSLRGCPIYEDTPFKAEFAKIFHSLHIVQLCVSVLNFIYLSPMKEEASPMMAD